MASEHWPLFDLRIHTPRLELRPPTDADAEALASLATAGVHEPEMMPFSTPWSDRPAPDLGRGALQFLWRQRAEWTPDTWAMAMAVVVKGPEPTIVGVQDVFASDWRAKRVVETGSWLGLAHQGQGIGKEMRAAVLHLAFAGLGAVWAETSAWEDNASSLGVTTGLGYEENGVMMDLRRGEGTPLRCFRMTRAAWEARRRRDIRIVGLDRCLDLFGLPHTVAGADACAGGWCVVTLPVEGPATAEVVPRLAPVAARQARGTIGALGVDIPIGLPEDRPRACDEEARALLGPRRSSVFPTPARDVLRARSYEDALRRSRAALGRGLSKQAWNLVPKIREVDRIVTPDRQGRIFECHPEAAFATLGGAPMSHPKRTSRGRGERLAVLRPRVEGIDELVGRPPKGAAPDDVLDAAVVALTARSLWAGTARRLGERRHDRRGLVQEIVVPSP